MKKQFLHERFRVIAIAFLPAVAIGLMWQFASQPGETEALTTCPTTANSGSDIVISSNCEYDASTDPTIDVSGGGDFTINSGVTVDIRGDDTVGPNGIGVTIIADNIDIQGDIDGNSLGSISISGTGDGGDRSGCGGGGAQGGGGAGHGGYGGPGDGGGGGIFYGSLRQPTGLGALGGHGGCGGDIPGGSAIKLDATGGNLTIDGAITMNASNATLDAGGGSGGSIWLIGSTVTGTGSLDANGGNGNDDGGGGAGGRIAVYYNSGTSNISGITMNAYGGTHGGSGVFDGGAGTIYLEDEATVNDGQLIIGNNNNPDSADTEIATTATFEDLTVKDGADFDIAGSSTLTIDNSLSGSGTAAPTITIESGSTFSPPAGTSTFSNLVLDNEGTLTSSGTLTFDSNGGLIANGGGYGGGISVVAGNNGTITISSATNFNPTTVTIQSGGTLTHTTTDAITPTTIDIQSGGLWTHADNSSSLVSQINASATDITINGDVTIDGYGFDATLGTGAGVSRSGCGGGGTQGGGGGAHGGDGASGGQGAGGASYGDIQEPITMGSGGGHDGCSGAGAGGGVAKIIASNNLTINGIVSANGTSSGTDDGGGAGGSIWMSGVNVTGTGTLRANGGNGLDDGGGGAGGRIALYYTTAGSNITGITRQAYGGSSVESSLLEGAAGTIYIKEAAATNGDLIIDNNSQPSSDNTPIKSAETFDNVTVNGGGEFEIQSANTLTVVTGISGDNDSNPEITVNSGATLDPPNALNSLTGVDLKNAGTVNDITALTLTNSTLTPSGGTWAAGLATVTAGSGAEVFPESGTGFSPTTLTMQSGSTYTQNTTDTISLGTFDLQSGATANHGDNSSSKLYEIDISGTTITIAGTVNVDGLGFDGSTGTGAGGNRSGCGGGGANGGGGGGHAGAGGAGGAGAGGGTYGDSTMPTTMGSGGGHNGCGGSGRQGGGVVKLVATGNLTISGSISADGISGGTNWGGGAGGSIWIDGGDLLGSGTLSADGGSGASLGGGGGGGYITYYYGDQAPSYTATATGGTGNNNGSDGTVLPVSTAECGDSIAAGAEECDDGNSVGGDGCSGTCRLECYQISSGLVSWWRGQNNYLDFQGANEGTQSGGVAFTTGKVGQAFSFDGSDDQITVSDDATLRGITSGTIAMWYKSDLTDYTSNGYLLNKNNTGNNAGDLGILVDQAIDKVKIFIQPGGAGASAEAIANDVVDTSWHHLAAVWTTNSLQLYIDGVLQTDDDTSANGGMDELIDLTIGSHVSDQFFDGLIDEVQIFNTALSATQIANLYTADAEGLCTSTCGAATTANAPACLGTLNVVPSFSSVTDDSSTVGSPTDAGSPVTFTATATDPNLDNYYLIVCADGDTVTSNSEAAPTCSSSQICVSSSTASGAQASCNSASVAATPETVAWESFVCDHSVDSQCSAAEFTNSPYVVDSNDPPELEAMAEDNSYHTTAFLTDGVTYASGLATQAFSFDGSDDHLEILDDISLDIGAAGTLMAWVNPDTFTATNSGFPRILQRNSTDLDTDGEAYSLGLDTTGVIRSNLGSGSSTQTLSGSTALTANVWSHVAFTWDASNMNVYLNGQNDGTAAQTVTPDDNASKVTIGVGRYTGANNAGYFDGEIDEVQMYSRALTADEIEAIYEARSGGICEVTTGCTGVPADLVSWWDAEGDLNDNYGTVNGTAVGDAAATGTAKVGNNSFIFDGTGDSIETSVDTSGFSEITLLTWARPDTTTAEAVVTTYFTQSAPSRGLFLVSHGGVDGRPDGGTYKSTGGCSQVAEEWALLAATFDGTTMRGYRNGVECGTAQTFTGPYNAGTQTHLGQFYTHADGGETDYSGELDEVMVFDRALTATEILAIYNADANHVCEIQCPIDNALVAHYTGDRDAYDNRHFNDGALTNGATITTSNGGKIDEAFSLDGTDDYVLVPDSPELTPDVITVAGWVNIDDLAGTSVIASKYNSNANKASWSFDSANSGDIRAFVFENGDATDTNARRAIETTSTALTTNTWHHVAFTFDSGDQAFEIYVDGVKQVTSLISGYSASVDSIFDGDNDVLIGADIPMSGSPSDFFDGEIDELMIFNRTLSAQEISNLYTAQNAGSHGGTCYESCLEEPANLVSHWQGDFDAKDAKNTNNASNGFETIDPGDTIQFRATLADPDLAAGEDTMVNLAVCPDGSTFNSGNLLEPCGNGVTPICTATHQRPGTVVCDDETNLTPIPTAHNASLPYEVFAWDQDDEAATYTASSAQTYAVQDVAPTINSFVLNGGSGAFSPTVGTTTNYSFDVTVSDNNGDGDLDQASESGKFYDEGASQTSACDDNTGTNSNAQQECYAASTCNEGSTIDGDAQATYTCTFPIYFNANPTAQWEAYFTVADDGANTVTGDSDTVSSLLQTINSIFGIDVVDNAGTTGIEIRYGNLTPGSNSANLTNEVNIANLGNTVFDTFVSGSVLCDNWGGQEYGTCPNNSVAVGNQEWAEIFGTTFGSGNDLEITSTQSASTCINNDVPVREINTQISNNDPIYFGIELPSSLPAGDYTGQNTFTSTSSTGSCNL